MQEPGRLATPPRRTTIEVPFKPARVVLQDFTGVPAVVDLAAMRSAMQRLGGDPKRINPLVPVDLVIDHSVQVDRFGSPDALAENVEIEFQRNRERYEFLRWGQKAFRNFRVVPPAVGIVHQVNLEFLAKCVFLREDAAGPVALPDTLVGTDSHTTMINGLGVVGWGVGGIEAEAVMLGQPLYMLAPRGDRLRAQRPAAARRHRHRPGAHRDANPPQRRRGRQVRRVLRPGVGEHEGGRSGRWWPTWRPSTAPRWASSPSTSRRSPISARPAAPTPRSSWSSATRRSSSCSARDDAPAPQLHQGAAARPGHGRAEPGRARSGRRTACRWPTMKQSFRQALQAPVERARLRSRRSRARGARRTWSDNGHAATIGHGAVVIAAITSCTNTSNPERDARRRAVGQEGGRAGACTSSRT